MTKGTAAGRSASAIVDAPKRPANPNAENAVSRQVRAWASEDPMRRSQSSCALRYGVSASGVRPNRASRTRVSICYSYRQFAECGAQVRKGERASLVVFWKTSGTNADEQDGADDQEQSPAKRRFFARGYSVFNVAQVDGYEPEAQPVLDDAKRHAHADAFIASLGVAIEHGGDSAYYRPSTDTVHLPCFASFRDAASYYGVAIHELGHASGAKHRLDRDLSGRFGTRAYAAEEACVELAAGFLLADLGIAHHPRPDHAAYLSSWLEILKDDARAIFTAASKAQAIADWMHAAQPASATQAA
jgi:antirestriction protein ArdC